MTGPGGVRTEAEIAEVCQCLDKILASPIFTPAGRQQRFLRFIVTQTLAGRADQLKGYTIGVEVFDRAASFDPAVDAIVRVEAARLRAKLREYYDNEGRADPVRIELPKGAYAIRVERQGPDAAARRDGAHAAAVHRDGAWTAPRVQPIEDRPSLAVLPLANMSSDPEQEYFADGITDGLITELSRLSDLFIISRHSSFIYKGLSKRAEEIGRDLGVRYLLEGSVQRSGDRVRIRAQLVDSTSGAHLWAECYDREVGDIFALQDDVTRRVVAVLRVKLTGVEAERLGHEGTSSVEAHDHLLRGLERFWLFAPESVEAARAQFARAVDLDPRYAAGHAWLARALVFQWIMLWDPRPETLNRAYDHARLAVELDEHLPLAHSMLGWVQQWRKQAQASIAAGWRAVTLDPNNADAHLFLSFSLSAAGRGEEALHYIEKGIRLNPHPSAAYQLGLGLSYLVLEEYDRAIAAFQRGVEVNDVFIPNHLWLCIIHTLLGHDEEARIERQKVLTLTGGRRPATQDIWLDEDLGLRMRGLVRLAGLA